MQWEAYCVGHLVRFRLEQVILRNAGHQLDQLFKHRPLLGLELPAEARQDVDVLGALARLREAIALVEKARKLGVATAVVWRAAKAEDLPQRNAKHPDYTQRP